MRGIGYFFVLFLFFPCLILAENQRDLELPSVTIEGKDKLQGKDEFYFDDDLSKHWQIEGDFDFDAELLDLDFAKKKDSSSAKIHAGFIDFWFGYGHQANLKAVYHNLQNNFLDFEIRSKNYWYDENWNSWDQSFFWNPNFGESNIAFSFEELDTKADSIKSKVIKGGFSWNLVLQDTILENLQLYFCNELVQQDYLSESQSKNYANFGISPQGKFKEFLFTADFFHYADGLNSTIKIRKNVNKWGFYTADIWMGFSRDKFVPSLGFLGLYFLPNKMFVQVENSPTISKRTHFDELSDNYYQSADYKLSQELTPLDFTLKCGYKRYFNVFSNLSYKMNHLYYEEVTNAKVYLTKEKDFLLNRSGAEVNLDYKNYSLSASFYRDFVINREENYIPYEPAVVSKITISNTLFEMITTDLSFSVSQLINDNERLKLDDKFDLSLRQSWNVRENLNLDFKILNLLGNELNKLPAYPERGLQVYAGVKWYF